MLGAFSAGTARAEHPWQRDGSGARLLAEPSELRAHNPLSAFVRAHGENPFDTAKVVPTLEPQRFVPDLELDSPKPWWHDLEDGEAILWAGWPQDPVASRLEALRVSFMSMIDAE